MGKNVRAKKRADAAQLEIVNATARHVETSHITEKTDTQLFLLDTTAAAIPKELQPKPKEKPKHQVTAQKVQALLEKHDPATLRAMANPPKKRKSTPAFDLWTEEEKEEPNPAPLKRIGGIAPPRIYTKAQRVSKPRGAPSTIAVDVAQSGQSYHPDPHHHQNVIGEALALELRRQEAMEQRDAPLASGLSEETKAILMGDDDDDDCSSSEDEVAGDAAAPIFVKQKKKLTRAQRNRQKRIRAQQVQEIQKKQAKKRMNAISEAKKLNKELKKSEYERKEQKAQLQLLKSEAKRILGKSVLQQASQKHPITAPTLPVALSDEISGSLRTMKPKGSLVTDRMESFRDRNMAESKRTKKTIVQGNKRRKLKIRGGAEREGQDYLLMG
jgi:nucleolar protein 53